MEGVELSVRVGAYDRFMALTPDELDRIVSELRALSAERGWSELKVHEDEHDHDRRAIVLR